MEWKWDVDKKFKKETSWFVDVVEWYIRTAEEGEMEAVASHKTGRIMVMFRGTEEECQEYIDEHTK